MPASPIPFNLIFLALLDFLTFSSMDFISNPLAFIERYIHDITCIQGVLSITANKNKFPYQFSVRSYFIVYPLFALHRGRDEYLVHIIWEQIFLLQTIYTIKWYNTYLQLNTKFHQKYKIYILNMKCKYEIPSKIWNTDISSFYRPLRCRINRVALYPFFYIFNYSFFTGIVYIFIKLFKGKQRFFKRFWFPSLCWRLRLRFC